MAENDKSSNYDAQTEKITNPARISAILKNILEARTLLSVTLPDSAIQYNSVILEINRDHSYILLDELNPKAGHERLLKSGKLAVFTHLNGVDVGFKGILQKVQTEDAIAAYEIQFPTILYYRQLRAHFRIPIGITEIPVKLRLDDDIKLQGLLHDISSGGLSIRFTSQLPAELKRGSLIESCTVNLPDANKIESKFEVRFRGKEDEKGRILIGGKFVSLDKVQQRMIERYVAALDREIRRKS
ncbi:MAG: flagellar brake protein [Gammaproteobacteria bacterium]|nr:flagellar brake protein [Gammaproteobacteria bacterium]